MQDMRHFPLRIAFMIACAALSGEPEAKTQDLPAPQDQSVVNAAQRSREQKKNATSQSRVITNDDLELSVPRKKKGPGASEAVASQAGNQAESPTSKGPQSEQIESKKGVPDSAETAELKRQVADAEKELNLQRRDLALAQQIITVDAEMAALRGQVADAERDLNLQQRELALHEKTTYLNPRYLVNQTGKAELHSEQQRLVERQQEIEGLKERYDELQWRQRQLKQAAAPN